MSDAPNGEFSPVFVTGVARSGTTWVFDLLSKHPTAVGWFESWMFTPQGVSPLFSDRHWSDDPERPRGLGRFVSRPQLVESVRGLIFSWVAERAEPGQTVWVEKSPGEIDFDTIDELFPGARFVHVVRDGRDVALSIRAASQSWAPGWKQGFGRTMAHAARHWAQGINRGLEAGERFGSRWLDVRFEELRADPVAELKRMWDHCGLAYEEDLARSVLDRTDIQKLIDQGAAGTETTFRRRGGVGEWREELSSLDRVVFAAMGGAQLKRLGYADRRWFR